LTIDLLQEKALTMIWPSR